MAFFHINLLKDESLSVLTLNLSFRFADTATSRTAQIDSSKSVRNRDREDVQDRGAGMTQKFVKCSSFSDFFLTYLQKVMRLHITNRGSSEAQWR